MFALDEISRAHELVLSVLSPTAALNWPLLSARVGAEVIVKHENHLPTGAFKVRGGLVYVDALRRRAPNVEGIISATRGNHGQSLAFAGARLGLSVTIVAPHGNSREKNAAMRALGAELIEHGPDFQAAREAADGSRASADCISSPRFTATSRLASRPTRSSFSASIPTSTRSMFRSARVPEFAAASPPATRSASRPRSSASRLRARRLTRFPLRRAG